MQNVGTISRGIKAPIIKQGDCLVKIVCDSVLEAARTDNFSFYDRDVVAVTEAVVARAQGNYATLAQISEDVRAKTGGGTVGLVFPILSRNRFALILRAIAQGVGKLCVQLSYPADEVGNPLIPGELLEEKNINPYTDSFTEKTFYEVFGHNAHPFTGVDYIKHYKEAGANIEIIISNNITEILKKTKVIINADIHTRARTKSRLCKLGAEKVISLDEILSEPVSGSGYNPQYGLLGSNLATDDSVKLFPRDTQEFVDALSAEMTGRTGKKIEAMVYGDGAFKDPVAGIWELADPMVSPAYTAGLAGTPNEIKLKFAVDNQLKGLSSEAAAEAVKILIKEKADNLTGDMRSQGTTPRRITDLLGSLCDLTSGSGDKGTPIVLIQNYFGNYSD